MGKKFLIAGNWKMYKTVAESIDFYVQLDKKIRDHKELSQSKDVAILTIPPFTALHAVKTLSKAIQTGAQNFSPAREGAFTGEISPVMLKELVNYVLIGHSERREIFKETDEEINRKIQAALEYKLQPILCLGESLAEREGNQTANKIKKQIDLDFKDFSPEKISQVIIAYEPIWAIGTDRNATPQQAQETHALIRNYLREKGVASEKMMILYGGSVKPENSFDLLSQKDIDGALIGGASLKVESFFAIIENALKIAKC